MPVLFPGTAEATMYTFLVVDDDDAVRRSVVRLLGTDPRYRCVPVSSCAEALQVLESGRKFDLLITDLELGTMSGLVLIATLQRARSPIPIILMSGNPKASAPAGVRFMPKPFGYDVLMSTVATSLGIDAVT